MKRSSRARILSALLTLAMVFTMLPAAWAAEGSGDDPTLHDESITLSIEGDSSVTVGSSASLSVSASSTGESTPSMSNIQWTVTSGSEFIKIEASSSPENASVTGIAQGSATITCTAEINSQSYSDDFTLTVNPKTVPVESISLNKTELSLKKGTSETLTLAFTPTDATEQTVTWSSDHSECATVKNGLVTAVAAGEATITVTTKDGDKTATCKVTVTEDPAPTPGSVAVSPKQLNLTVGETSTLAAATIPENQAVTWSSSQPSVAAVDSTGKVTAKAAGDAVITAEITVDGQKYTDTCAVKVSAKPVAPTLSNTSLSLNVSKSSTLTVNNLPAGATVSWSSSKPSVASVDSNGTVTGKSEGSATITATVKNGSSTLATLECKVTVTKGGVSTITYSVAVDKTLTLDRSDFNRVCEGVYGNTLDYVKFGKSSSIKGTLYFDYTEGDGGSKISTLTKYYYSNSGNKPISQITFVPDGNSGDTVTFPYVGYDSAGKSYNGTLEIRLTAPSGDISYETGKNEPITFTDSDFNSICKKITGSSLDYVTFGSVSSSKGALYVNYGEKKEEKLSTSDKCYYNDSPALSSVTFVPKDGYTGTFTISYSGRSNARDSFSGSVKITVRKSSSTLSYTVDPGKTLALDDSYFNDFCKDETGHSMDYVQITPPSSSKGTFYYRYGENRHEEEVSSSDKYYRSSSPRLDDVTFVPDDDYTGTLSVSFSGKSTDGESFSGTMKIRVGDADEGDITYKAAAGAPVTFDDDDFNAYCKDATDSSLDYVRFSLPSSSKGTLYYQYDESGEKKVTSSTSYYRSSSPRLQDVTFVPDKSYTGSVEISFTGRSTDDDSFSGTVVIVYSAPKDAPAIRYSTGSAPVNFSSADFVSACAARGAGSLTSVKFELPSTAAGKLYYGYTGPNSYGGLVSPAISFPAAGGSGSISAVTFVPRAGYNGTISINYTGTDSKNNTFTGKVEITVTPSTQSRRFTDMGSHGWAAAAVDFLYEGGVTTGTSATTYGPALNITRGDFILMLYRAFDLTAAATDGFKDVPANSYYAQAISVAKALGIAQGGSDGAFRPTAPLTREDAMVFLHRTLSRTGKTLAEAPAAFLNRFADGSSTSSYAQSSVASLVQAGVIQGDNNGRLNPKGSLTRAEMAVILHRVLTL